MNKHEAHQQICYRLLQVASLFLTGYFTIGHFAGILSFTPWHMVCAVVTILFLAGMNYTRLKGRLLCLFALADGFILMFFLMGAGRFASFWNNYLHWFLGDNSWSSQFLLGYEIIQTALIVIACYLLQWIIEKLPLLRILLSASLLIALLACMFLKHPISHPGVVFCCWYVILGLLEAIQHNWQKTGKHSSKQYVVQIMPFCIIYLIGMLLTPVSEAPYQWQWAKDLYHQVKEFVTLCYEEIMRDGSEDFALAGFSGSGRLAGNLNENRRHVLTVQGHQNLVTNVYLIGKVYGSFDGTTWAEVDTNDANDRYLDAMETDYAVRKYDDLMENYISHTNLKIRYEHFRTAYVFAPLKSLKINDCEYVCDNDSLLFRYQKGYQTTYDVNYTQLNLNAPAFYRMLEIPPETDEELWQIVAKKYKLKDQDPVTIQELEEHRSHIRENYSQKPLLSEETEAYVNNITKDCTTDLQKLLAIEAELSSYAYTETPGALPESITCQEDFLDFFLLEGKQGFCCHFATAFVLLARAEGFPARYVEGFCVPVSDGKTAAVYSDMAHAWPEVYIEGFGWIPFEPTPGYEKIRYTPWQLKQKTTSSSYSGEEIEEWEEEEEATQEEVPSEPDIPSEPTQKTLPTVLLCIALLCMAIAFFWMLEQVIRRRNYRRMKQKDRMHIQFALNFWLLSKLGYQRADTETLCEFSQRIPMPCTFINCYEEILYGGRPVPEQIPEIILLERKQLLALIKEKRKLLYPIVWLRLKAYEP